LESDEQSHWSSRDLLERFEAISGFKYTESHWHYLLRHYQKMYYYKPAPTDYRKNEEDHNQLSERIKTTFDALRIMGKDPVKFCIGFCDEMAGQLHSNNT
jgi:hypothetical protein